MINKRYNKSISRISSRNNRFRKVKIAFIFLIPVILFSGIFYLSRLPSLQVSFIEVSGEKSIAKDDVKNAALESISGKILGVLPRTNVFLVNEGLVASVLASEFPRIEKVDVEKNANGVLKVEIKEREGIATWCSNSCYLLDNMGLIYSSVNNDLESFEKIIFRGGVEGEPIMKHFLDQSKLKSFLSAAAVLKSNNINVSSVNINSVDKATIQTDIGDIFVDPNTEALEEQVENALLVVEDKRNKNPNIKFEYIDTRFGNKVFYK